MTARFPLTRYSPSMSRPLRSTAFTHFSTKRGTLLRSCAHSTARWQPKTLSAEGGDQVVKKEAEWMTSDLLKMTPPTSDVSFLLDRLQRRPLHQELHQFGANPAGVAVPR